MLLDNTLEKNRLSTLLLFLGLSLLSLLYILGKHAWLPRMGGPFARSYREIRKLAKTPQGNTPEALRKAVSSMHASLNATAGNSLFSGNLDQYLAKKPTFNVIKSEMLQFFGLSNQVFFEPNAKHGVGSDPIQWLTQFCRQCRDCERGLIPDTLSTDTLSSVTK